MTLAQLLTNLRCDPAFMMNVMAWRTIPAVAARHAPIPPALHPALQTALHQRQIKQLYSHQAAAVTQALAGDNLVVVTPTASGKTLCYNLPVLDALLREPAARALYLYPTKALAQDQQAELQRWEATLPPTAALHAAVYDGDTPGNARTTIRQQSRLLLSNPDMLHVGILPYHTAWEPYFANLRYVVIDELHSYRGVFGSHVANVLRRVLRICRLYGSEPRFICTSATIANPRELATQLVEAPVTLIDQNGAPQGEKQIILYNPPLYDEERGLRRSAVLEAQELATRALQSGLQTILFGRARLTTEVLLTYLRERLTRRDERAEWAGEAPEKNVTSPEQIRGYRGGYLPNERRAIEAGLRDGSVRGVVATNALELGIDIGGLQAAVLCGYPGTIAGTWQQMGRAGRTVEGALAILVATGGLLDQYIIQHPDYIFDRSPEHALINPDNLLLLIDHLRCAAFELPFAADESFGNCPFTADALQLLCEQGDLQQHGQRFFWSGESYPARAISLRSAGGETVVIQVEQIETIDPAVARSATVAASADVDFYTAETTARAAEPLVGQQRVRVIGQLDWAGAQRLLHQGAIYLHEGRSYHVQQLDMAQRVATVAPTNVDFYTEAIAETEIEVLSTHDELGESERGESERGESASHVAHGDLLVSTQVVGYRQIKHFTHENLGVFPLDYPPHTLETSGYWFTVSPAAQAALASRGEWFDAVNDYGPNWQRQRKAVRARDHYRCSQCGRPEAKGRQHDVHHRVPFRTFGYVPGLNERYREANQLANLTLVCRACHRRLEAGVRVRGGLDGLAYALMNLAPLHLMCDPQDLGSHVVRAERDGHARTDITKNDAPAFTASPSLPTIYLYERITAGLGFSARLYELHDELLQAAAVRISACPCEAGCPACVGPVLEGEQAQLATKALTLALLRVLREM